MRFIPLASARRIQIGQEVFTINEEGKHAVGKLHSRIETAEGNKTEFEVPVYHGQQGEKPVLVSNITHVAFPTDRKKDEEEKK